MTRNPRGRWRVRRGSLVRRGTAAGLAVIGFAAALGGLPGVAVAGPAVSPATRPAAASPVSGAPSAAAPGARVVAVVTTRPHTRLPLRVRGLRVLDVLSRVRAEVVSGPPAALHRLAATPGVAGVSPNVRGTVAASSWSGAGSVPGEGYLAPALVGGQAGQPGAGAGVTVALLDTGVDDTPALNRASGRLVDGIDVSGLPSGQPARTSGTFTDGYGHGTFLASLIAGGPVPGSSGQSLGVAPAATVEVVKVADDTGTTSLWQVLAGLNWVALHANTINVVNLSFAVTRPTAPAYGADPLTAAVDLVRRAGVTVVAAVGNTPGQVGDPGMAPAAITVGAADLGTGGVAGFSGYGDVDGMVKPDLVASGVNVLGAMAPGTVVAQQNPGAWQPDGLFRGSGTSEATAIASGAAAVLLSQHPWLPPVGVKAAMRLSAQPLGDPRAGAGLLSLPAGDTPGTDFWNCWHSGHARCGQWKTDPTGESSLDQQSWWQQAWLGGQWLQWLASSWSASSWSASSWSASSWSASSWSASSWSASSWSASSWSASSWSTAYWGSGP